jgi:hypothetical protein
MGGVVAALGCTVPVIRGPKPVKLVAARAVWALALGCLAVAACSVSKGSYRGLELGAIGRNVMLAQGAGLVLVACGVGALAWAPAVSWLLAAILLGGGTDGGGLGFGMMLASKASNTSLGLALVVWLSGVCAYALLAGGKAPRQHPTPRRTQGGGR